MKVQMKPLLLSLCLVLCSFAYTEEMGTINYKVHPQRADGILFYELNFIKNLITLSYNGTSRQEIDKLKISEVMSKSLAKRLSNLKIITEYNNNSKGKLVVIDALTRGIEREGKSYDISIIMSGENIVTETKGIAEIKEAITLIESLFIIQLKDYLLKNK